MQAPLNPRYYNALFVPKSTHYYAKAAHPPYITRENIEISRFIRVQKNVHKLY